MASIRRLAIDAVKTATGSRARWMTTAAAEDMRTLRRKKGKEMVPVYVLAGMVTVAVGLGLHSAKQQLLYAPDVHVKKSKRETLPEVVEPEEVVEEAEKFINKSFFRKVAHVQELDSAVGVGGDVFSRKPRAETLKDVGVDPKQV